VDAFSEHYPLPDRERAKQAARKAFGAMEAAYTTGGPISGAEVMFLRRLAAEPETTSGEDNA
jgi:hypothetical protein